VLGVTRLSSGVGVLVEGASSDASLAKAAVDEFVVAALMAAGVDCPVCAPSLIPRGPE
jgi:hypothetical protein